MPRPGRESGPQFPLPFIRSPARAANEQGDLLMFSSIRRQKLRIREALNEEKGREGAASDMENSHTRKAASRHYNKELTKNHQG